MFAHLPSSPERSAAIEEVVGKMLGTIPMKEPLPDHILPLGASRFMLQRDLLLGMKERKKILSGSGKRLSLK
jgi:hypothetical protein